LYTIIPIKKEKSILNSTQAFKNVTGMLPKEYRRRGDQLPG